MDYKEALIRAMDEGGYESGDAQALIILWRMFGDTELYDGMYSAAEDYEVIEPHEEALKILEENND